MNYSQGFPNDNNYMSPSNPYPYYGNMQMPVMGMACMDNMGYISSMPFIPDSYIPIMSNMPMPNGDMPALPWMPRSMPGMPNGSMPGMPGMPNGSMPTMPGMPGMPNSSMPTMPTMPGMPSMPTMPGMPNGSMPTMPDGDMPAMPYMPNGNMPTPGMPMNCQQLMEYMHRMNCMEHMNNMNNMPIEND